jgi:hypothetical protein
VGKLEGKRQPLKPRNRWEDNIRRDLKDAGWDWVDGMIYLKVRISGRLL